MSRKISEISLAGVDDLTIARDSVHKIRRVSEDSLQNFFELDTENVFRLFYLRKQFSLKELEGLFDRYTERINQAYFSQFLLLQALMSLVHFVVVFLVNFERATLWVVVPDLTLYSATCVLSAIFFVLNERYVKNRSRLLTTLTLSIFALVFFTDLAVPIYYGLAGLQPNLRPAYTTHLLITAYVFCNIRSDLGAFLLGLFVSVSHLLTLAYVTYRGREYFWTRIGSDSIYLLTTNLFGIVFRLANELVKRRSFLDRRARVELTLKLQFEKEQEEQLMLSIIPRHTMHKVQKDILNKIELLEKMIKLPTSDPMGIPYVEEFDDVTILYADIVNYTAMTSQLPVLSLVATLNELFGGFDDASEELKVLRIKFLGDCYYSVAGLPPNPPPNHAEACVDLGLKMIEIIRSVREKRKLMIDMRIGVHSGRILSGLIGSKKWQFDIWSKDVHLANKMETSGEPGKIHVTQATYDLLSKEKYNITASDRGTTDAHLKPYGVATYFISPANTDGEKDEVNSVANNDQPKSLEKKKKLSVIGENDGFSSLKKVNGFEGGGEGVFRRSHSEAELGSDCNGNLVAGHNPLYERRESVRNSVSMVTGVRRLSSHPVVAKRLSGRRATPGRDDNRRTASSDIKRYNEILEKTKDNLRVAIEEMPLTKYDQWVKIKDINSFFLTFRNFKMEQEFVQLPDPLFKYYLIVYVCLLISVLVIQNLTISQWEWHAWLHYGTLTGVAFVLTPLTWFQPLWNRYYFNSRSLSEMTPRNGALRRIYVTSAFVTNNAALRTAIFLLLSLLFLACVLKELMECSSSVAEPQTTLFRFLLRDDALKEDCIIPWHMSHTLSLTILMCFSFLRIHVWLKLLFAAAVTAFYSTSVWNLNYEYYKDSETFNYMMRPQIAHVMALLFLTVTLHVIDRESDYLNRLDYQWNQKLLVQQTEINTMHKIIKLLLRNILPMHVAEIYLDRNRSSRDQCNRVYDDVAVIFASVVDAQSEMVSDKFFLGIMNRIVKDFDHLLSKERRRHVEKIKVTNMCYMAACGLDPERTNGELEGAGGEHVAVALVKFAVDMIAALKQINRDGFDCKLRIGISNGPVMAGVVGWKKPFYDIWGDTVNLASRMDSTGLSGRIQITENTAQILRQNGIQCEFRGHIFVKGKGDRVPTYFVRLTDEDDLIYDTQL